MPSLLESLLSQAGLASIAQWARRADVPLHLVKAVRNGRRKLTPVAAGRLAAVVGFPVVVAAMAVRLRESRGGGHPPKRCGGKR